MEANHLDTPYGRHLAASSEQRRAAAAILNRVEYTPVGAFPGELILNPREAVRLVRELEAALVAVPSLSLWCYREGKKCSYATCPGGLGGPGARGGIGWYSECAHLPIYDVEDHGLQLDDPSLGPERLVAECSRLTRRYLEVGLLGESFYSPCLCPGLWLHVPDGWIDDSALAAFQQ